MLVKSTEPLFNVYLKEGRELGVRELSKRYPSELRSAGRALRTRDVRLICRKVKKLYRDRWNEIYGYSLGIVTEPAEQMDEETAASLTILEKMRMARGIKCE